jgi:hypothetical protein
MAISLRLDDQMTSKLTALAKAKGISRSALIRECLDQYLRGAKKELTPWELGKDLFNCFNSGVGNLSVRVEEIARERIHAKHAKRHRG